MEQSTGGWKQADDGMVMKLAWRSFYRGEGVALTFSKYSSQ